MFHFHEIPYLGWKPSVSFLFYNLLKYHGNIIATSLVRREKLPIIAIRSSGIESLSGTIEIIFLLH